MEKHNLNSDQAGLQEEDRMKADGIVYAGRNSIFAVRYTLDMAKRQFYPFYAVAYKPTDTNLEFIDAKVPGSLCGNTELPILYQFGQSISSPSLDKRFATVFIYKTQRPTWFDKTEEDVVNLIKKLEATNPEQLEAFNGILNPLITQVLKK